ncbi:MAG: PEGA domain-containing protein, partial [Deltaproteobacteria bacterium]|nr:PEGA domain-containing protein [Deltaproteobacteria bacterium]
MNRLFTIYQHDQVRKLHDADLPLIIGSSAKAHIHLPEGSAVEAHIAESRGHLFLQPAEGNSTVYHNNVNISSSVWIKSGDQTRIADSVLHFLISGDRVEIRLATAAGTALTPPPSAPSTLSTGAPEKQEKLPRTSPGMPQPRKNKKLYYLAGIIFFLLVAAAAFVLMARSLEVAVEPAPKKLTISGFPPALRFGSHYLALKGEYTIQASRQGYHDLSALIKVKTHEANHFTFTLQKLPGSVEIICTPPVEAEVFIDDLLVGHTPFTDLKIPAGEHQLRLIKKGYLTIEQPIRIEGLGKKQNFTFELQLDQGKITVVSNPAGAMVFTGKTELGTTPLSKDLPSGTYTLTLRKKGFSPAEIKIDVGCGGTYTPEIITLFPAPATVSITSTPS